MQKGIGELNGSLAKKLKDDPELPSVSMMDCGIARDCCI
jgi:hypothetical protein